MPLRSLQILRANTYQELLDAEIAGTAQHDALVFISEAGRQCTYFWDGDSWTRGAGKFTAIDPASNISMAGGVLNLDKATLGSSLAAATAFTPGLMTAADYADLRGLDILATYWRRAQIVKTLVSVGTSNSDAAVFTNLPAEYAITALWVFDPSSTLALVTAGLYRTAGGLNNVIPLVAMTALTGSTVVFPFVGVPVTVEQTSPNLYFRVGTPKAGATCSVMLEIVNLADS